ncbi:hypothetical protein GALL_447820 [mine drainage metagenome]|uniref:Uncharacterized protein n=1 Tax=mine drainage metagenome TaxID=410659 RepID=A0A1J5Q142_9ZZZZ
MPGASQLGGHRVRDVQDRLVVAPRDAQREPSRPRARGVLDSAPELVPETLEPACARPAPSVDGLLRVADGHHRVPVAEQLVQEPCLHHGGVLVLVEQHHPEPRPLAFPDRRDLAGEPLGQRHLIAEVEGLVRTLTVPVGVHDVQDPDPLLKGRDEVADLGVGRTRGLARRGLDDRVDDVPDPRARLGRCQDVLVEGAVEGPHRGDDRRDGGLRRQVLAPVLDDIAGELPLRRLPEDAGPRFDPDPEHVVADEGRGVRVVRRDRRAREVEDTLGRHRAGQHAVEVPQSHHDSFAQLSGRLARERQTEDLVGLHQAVGDEVHHACGHGLGLPGARAGDDEDRLERGLDDRLLLGRGLMRLPEQRRDLDGAEPGHRPTCSPSSCAGQLRRTGHIGHRSLTVAVKHEAAIASTAPAIARWAWVAPVSSGSSACWRRSA